MTHEQTAPGFDGFLATEAGAYLLDWEQRLLDHAVADIFGYRAVQLGMPQLDALRENRMPMRMLTLDVDPAAARDTSLVQLASLAPAAAPAPEWRLHRSLLARFDELPFGAQSLDLVVMPHVLELADEPHRVLREVDRVLVPDGHVVITGFNPASLWGLRRPMRRLGLRPYLPDLVQPIALPRLKDWLKLLSFEVNRGRFGCYVPAVRTQRWLTRFRFLEKAGDRWWPVLGSVYALTAVKRVRGMRLIGPGQWRRDDRRSVLVPAPAVPLTKDIRG